MKTYYLTNLECILPFSPDPITVVQLCLASSKENARNAVKEVAEEEYEGITILEIRVNETIIGK